MNKKLVFIVLTLLIALIPFGLAQGKGEQPPTSPPNEPWLNSTTEFRPDIGLMDLNLKPGENGYKIFNPGGISILSVKGQEKEPDSILATRIASTDAFGFWQGENFYGAGDHDSENDSFPENEIWVTGCVKKTGNTTWGDCDTDNTSGYIAHADTAVIGHYNYDYTAKSWHHFHTSGIVDWNPITQDTWT